jgi:parallel beta-helix repeat protein
MSCSQLTGKGSVVSGILARVAKAVVEALESRVLLSSVWFVAPSGSNLNSGTLAAPFQTIQAAANVAHAGDTVEIRAGVYHETVTVPNSGTAAAPITFEAYNNESVTIDGADAITGWTNAGGPVFTAPMRENLGQGNNQLFVDGQMMNEARWPNTGLDLSYPALATVAYAMNATDASTIHDAALNQPAGFWAGAAIGIGAGDDWVMQSGAVTASGPGWVTFNYNPNGTEVPVTGDHFYLTGAAGALDSAGEWFRASNGTVSLWTPSGDNPADHVVEAKARKYGFDLSRAAFINIQGIHLFACTINSSGNSRGVHINQITAEYLSQMFATTSGWLQPDDTGIVLKGAGDILSNSIIAYSAGDGVYVTGANSRVTNNLIHDVDYAACDAAGVRVGANNVTIDHNTIYNTGRDGIYIHTSGSHVLYNNIHDFGLQTTDCGGVYTIGMDGGGTEIAYNTVYNGVTPGYGGSGLYLDNNSSGFVVDHNITYNVNTGLKMNMTSQDETIVNNTLDATQFSVNKTWGAYDWSGSIVQNNIFTRPVQFGVNASISHNATIGSSGFVNQAQRDYRLAAGSPAIGAAGAMAPYTDSAGGAPPDDGALAYGASPFADGAVIAWLPGSPSAGGAPPVVSFPPPVAKQPGVSPVAAGSQTRSARSVLNALSFDAKYGSAAASLGGLGYNFAGSWVEFSSIDFGDGVSHVTLQFAVADAYAGKKIVLRLDGPTGPVIGTLVTAGTGSWATYTAQTTAIAGATGIHNLYLCMGGVGAVGNIKTMQFS